MATATSTHATSLYRVLRLLTAVDLFTEGEGHSFELAPLGVYLQTDVPGSLCAMALAYGETPFWPIWGALLHSVQTGEPCFKHIFGLPTFEYYAQYPEQAELFDHCMTELTASVAPTIASAYDFSASSTLVDVGGGHGQMLASILQANPALHGVLFDLPQVVRGAPPLLEAAGVSGRCQVIGGDACTTVPADYDTYMLSRVIHDWDDEHTAAIFARCHQAMSPMGKLLLVERVIPTDGTPELHVLGSDMVMLVAAGGKERTEVEYRALLEAARFRLTQLIPVLAPYYLIEAVRV